MVDVSAVRVATSGRRKRGTLKKSKGGDLMPLRHTVQWTVKGIDQETLELSRQAARKRGMKFGAWVTQALKSAAADENERSKDKFDLLAKIAEIELKIETSVSEIRTQNSNIQHDVRVLHMLMPRVDQSGG